jgi:heat shock protein HslJ
MKKMNFVLVVSAALLLVLPGILVVAGCGNDDDAPTGLVAVWQLQEFIPDTGAATTIADPTNYTVEFTDAGGASIKADCNRCSGSYTTDGSQLTFGAPMACTLAACGSDSYDGEFLAALATTSSYEIKDSQLYLRYEGGQMRFNQ